MSQPARSPSAEAPLERHPWSRDFAWAVAAGTLRHLEAAERAHFDREGWLVLEDLIPPAARAACVDAIDPVERELDAVLRGRPDGRLFIAEAGATTGKAYIVQYAREDAVYLRGDPAAGPPTAREPIRALPPSRQWRLPGPG